MLGASWAVLGPPWGALGPSWGHSWRLLGPLWAPEYRKRRNRPNPSKTYGKSMFLASEGALGGPVAALLGRLGGFLGPLGALLGRLESILGRLEAILSRLEAFLDPQVAEGAQISDSHSFVSKKKRLGPRRGAGHPGRRMWRGPWGGLGGRHNNVTQYNMWQ